MNVLVLNVGSTSVKYQLFDMDTEARGAAGRVEGIGREDAAHVHEGGRDAVEAPDARAALAHVLTHLRRTGGPLEGRGVDAVGHRVVHGGERLVAPTRIDAKVEAIIEECAVFAPLHNPGNLAGIRAARAALGEDVPQVAVFDTAFHGHMPEAAYTYAVPRELYLAHGVRRYGFHGPSHQMMALAAAEHLGTEPSRLKLVTCHLGGGASVAAIEGGVSVDTSMGMTPLEGLVMGTRSGDVDPAIPILLARQGLDADAIEDLLTRRSGLAALSGLGADFRAIEAAAAEGSPSARLAIDVFVHRLRKAIGAHAAVLGGLDAIVFSGGIGEHSALVRRRVCEPLFFLGVDLDEAANAGCRAEARGGIEEISSRRATTKVLVVTADEERMIAREVARALLGPRAAVHGVRARPIPVGVSVRHVHLSRRDCDALFGPGYELTHRRDVTQPGQYVTRETVDLVGPKSTLHRVAIIAPLRAESQVEVSRTDAFGLGVDPKLRESGQLEGTPGLTLRGPAGEVTLPRGVILAHRHVHMSPDEAQSFGLADHDVITVRVEGDREMTMGDVIVRVHRDFRLDLHLDTDEANGAGLDNDSVVAFAGKEAPHPD